MERLRALLGLEEGEETERLLERLIIYRQLLIKWNQRMDLTNVPGEDIPLRHFGDSLLPLYAYPQLFPRGAKLVDVGTGAGFPGLPLAIARPDLQVALIEPMQKRCEFLSAVLEAISLSNARVFRLRAEDAGRNAAFREAFDITVSRAVAPLPVLTEYMAPLTQTGGAVLCWKGPAAGGEAAEAENACAALGCGRPELLPLSFPGEERWLVKAVKEDKTPERYPRRAGIPVKRPIR